MPRNGATRIRSKPSRSKASAQSLEARTNEAKAVKLRLQGLGYEAIGEQLGVAGSTAYRAVMRYLERTASESAESLEQVRQLEVARYDLWLSKVSERIDVGELDAIDVGLRISARRAKLLGCDVERPQVNVDVQVAVTLPPEVRELAERAERGDVDATRAITTSAVRGFLDAVGRTDAERAALWRELDEIRGVVETAEGGGA